MPTRSARASACCSARKGTGTRAGPRLQREHDILPHRKIRDQAFGLALLGTERETLVDGVRRALQRDALGIHHDVAAVGESSPNRRRASSVRPDPSRPAMPTISPALNAMSIG